MWDRDIDRLMTRTMLRPVARGAISPRDALIFAALAQSAGFAMLYLLVNPLAAWLSLAGNAYYVFVYTMWLKRVTPLNIVVGGAAGAIPPLVGWAAVTHQLGSPAFALFAVIFLWTPPHFWALALMTNTDYEKAGIPMLPNVKGIPRTKREILIYSLVLVARVAGVLPAARARTVLRRLRGDPRRRVSLGCLEGAAATGQTLRASAVQVLAAVPRADVRRDGRRPHHPAAVTRRSRPLTPREAGTVAGHPVDASTRSAPDHARSGRVRGALDLGVLSPALPALGATFGVGPRDLAWVFTLYLLANVVAIPVMTKLADAYGRRPVYILCVSIFAAGSVLAIAAPSYAIFLAARAIQAAGAGGIFPVATAAIADRVPLERRGAGARAGRRDVGPRRGDRAGRRRAHHALRSRGTGSLRCNVPLAIVVIAMARTTVPARAANARGPLDVAGIVTLAIGLLATMALLTRLVRDRRRRERDASRGACSAWPSCVRAVRPAERRAPQPVIPPRFFRDRQMLSPTRSKC